MATPDTAVFLAAGRGLRLGPRGREIPKGFLEVGGLPLMERAIGLLRAAGIAEIVIVTGHLRAHYEALAERLGSGVRTVFNPHYASHGSGRSLEVGLAATQGAFLLFESDVVWEARGLPVLLDSPAESLLLTSGPTGGGDEVWVWPDGTPARPTLGAMSKRAGHRADPCFGELVGIMKVGRALRTALGPVAAAAVAADAMADYESCMVAASALSPMDLVRIDDFAWAEIDDETMLARAVDVVMPQILARDAAGAAAAARDGG